MTLRKSAQRRLNSTIDHYKKPSVQGAGGNTPSGRITQNMIMADNRSRTNMTTQAKAVYSTAAAVQDPNLQK